MALQTYRIDEFKGIDQNRTENALNAGYTASCANMDTRNGDLSVVNGFSRVSYSPNIAAVPIPPYDPDDPTVASENPIRAMYVWEAPGWTSETSNDYNHVFVAVAGNKIYYRSVTNDWNEAYTYSDDLQRATWQFHPVKIGNTDYLLIANGSQQIVKMDTVGRVEPFGTGEWVHETTVMAVKHNAEKALTVQYEEDDTTKTAKFTLTMPDGWVGDLDSHVAFDVPADMGNVLTVQVAIGLTTYNLSYVPFWSAGDTAVFTITGEDAAEPYEDNYGVKSVTLTDALPEEWNTRVLAIGLNINGITYPIEEVRDNGATLVFEQVITTKIKEEESAKLRGGLSNIPVRYMASYYSRLFTAGDDTHPTRLYWSQAPGDARSIEDWSMDDISDSVSGGHVDIGNTSDRITGLFAMMNQLLIFKEKSIYRLLGDRPSTFRVASVLEDSHTATQDSVLSYKGIPYWMTSGGMYYHNGTSSGLTASARQIRSILDGANVGHCRAAVCKDRFYFSINTQGGAYDDSIIVYDVIDRSYMLLTGFHVIALSASRNALYMVNENRYLYKWDDSTTFDGETINAYWYTPKTDMQAKTITKAMKTMYLRGTGGIVLVDTDVGGYIRTDRYQMPESDSSIIRIPLRNEGRVVQFKFYNENGSHFRIMGGIEVRFEAKEDG